MTMTTNSHRFLEAFRLEEVPITKREVFPEEKWPKALRKEFNEANSDSIYSKYLKLEGKNQIANTDSRI